MKRAFQNQYLLMIISSFLIIFSTSSVFADEKFPINVEVTELQEFDGVRNNSLLEKTLIRPRFLTGHDHNKHWGYHSRLRVETLYLCESDNKCDSIDLSKSNAESQSNQQMFPYFVGQPKKYLSIWVEYKANNHKRKFKHLKLKETIDYSNAYAYEMFFEARGNSGHSVKYLATGGVAASDGTVILYRPHKGIKNLKVGSFKVTIPKRAAKKPFVIGFNALERENDPRKRLYIESSIVGQQLSKKMKIQVDMGELPASKTLDDYEFKYGKEYLQPKVLKSGFVQIRSNILENSFQVRDQDPLRKYLPENDESTSSNIAQTPSIFAARSALLQSTHSTDECVNQLRSLYGVIDDLIRNGNHNVYTSVCEDLDPEVWITVTDLSNVPDVRLTFPQDDPAGFMTVTEQRDGENTPANQVIEAYYLRNIIDHANKSGAAINVNGGFWVGDEDRIYDVSGIFPIGGFHGVVHDAGYRQEGFLKYENLIFLGFRKNNQYLNNFNSKLFVTPRTSIGDTPDTDLFNYQGYNYVTVPSDSTILKNGVCSFGELDYLTGDDNPNLWTAIGITDNNRLVVLSSASQFVFTPSGYATTSYDMCRVFSVLGVKNAIRLDGGSSASISINGEHKNPLMGRNYLATGGSQRRVLYTLSLY